MNFNKTKIMSHEYIHSCIEDLLINILYLGHTVKVGKRTSMWKITRQIRLTWVTFDNIPNSNTHLFFRLITMVWKRQNCVNKLQTTQKDEGQTLFSASLKDKTRNGYILRRSKFRDVFETVVKLK